MGKIVSALFGGSAPKVSTAAVEQTQTEQRSANQGRAALYETAGGVTGAELNPSEIKKRQTLLGN